MKKIVICLVVLFSTFNERIIAQTMSGPCSEQQLGIYDKTIDSIHSFFRQVKHSLSPEDWNGFMNNLGIDSVEKAFDYCGNNRELFFDQFITVHNNFVNAINDLRVTTYTAYGNIPEDEKFVLTRQKIECHVDNLQDTVIMNGIMIGEQLAGPCLEQYKRDRRAARRARNAGWWNCTLGGLGLSLISGGAGLILGVACHSQNQLDYMEALEDAEAAYNDCLENQE